MWLNGSPIYMGTEQIAEVKPDKTFGYIIRSKRPNGTVGVCFSNASLTEIRDYLNANYPGWRKDRRTFKRTK